MAWQRIDVLKLRPGDFYRVSSGDTAGTVVSVRRAVRYGRAVARVRAMYRASDSLPAGVEPREYDTDRVVEVWRDVRSAR